MSGLTDREHMTTSPRIPYLFTSNILNNKQTRILLLFFLTNAAISIPAITMSTTTAEIKMIDVLQGLNLLSAKQNSDSH